jgi:hypothetical protein
MAEPERPDGNGGRRSVAVPFVVDAHEARSMKLGAPGQILVVQSPSLGRARTDDCGAAGGEYPVQTVLVTSGTNTYVTSIVVCRTEPLTPGETLGLDAAAPQPGGSTSRFTARQ